MQLIAVTTGKIDISPTESLNEWLIKSLKLQQLCLKDGDVLVISSKIISYFERQIINLSTVELSEQAIKYAAEINANAQLLQLALNEADEVIAPTPWVLLTRKNGIYCANAGVDTSNVPAGYAVVWPKSPFDSAMKLKEALQSHYQLKKLAIIIADSMCLPGRSGTLAIAIGYAGIEGCQHLQGTKDLFNNTLRYSALNIVDSVATAANLLMGEGAECTPLVIVRNFTWQEKMPDLQEMIIGPEDEMFPLVNSTCS